MTVLTSFEFICFGIVPNVWRLWLCDFHLTIFLGLSESEILLIPLQTRIAGSVNLIPDDDKVATSRGSCKILIAGSNYSLLYVGTGGVLEDTLWLHHGRLTGG